MRKRLLTSMLAGLALAATQLPNPAAAQDEVDVVMSSFGFLYLPVLAADQLGYYEEENLEVEITRTGGGSKALAAVVGGDADIYVGAPSSAFRARSQGTDVMVFGADMTEYASNLVITGEWAKKHGITEESSYQERLKALEGATIGVTSAGSGTDQLVRFLAQEAGLDPDRDMTITSLGGGETMTAALVQNRIQGFTHSAPVGENAVRNHDAVMLFQLSQGAVEPLAGFLYIGMIAREEWLEENEDVAVRFLRATQKALNTMHDPESTGKARDAVWEEYHSQTEKEFYDSVWKDTLPAFPDSVEINADMMKRIAEFVNEFEKEPLDPAVVESGWTNQYAEKAVASLKK